MIEIALAIHIILFVGLVIGLNERGFVNLYSGLSLYLVFHFVVFVQRPLIVYLFDLRSEFEFMNFMPTEDVFLQTLFVADVGLLSFIAAYLMALGFRPMEPTFHYIRPSRTEARSLLISFLLLAPLIFYSFFLAVTMRQTYGVTVFQQLGEINMTIDPATGQKL